MLRRKEGLLRNRGFRKKLPYPSFGISEPRSSTMTREGSLRSSMKISIWSARTAPTPRTGLGALTTAWSGGRLPRLCHNLDMQKPVIICGDLNVAHQEIDLKHPKANRGTQDSRRGARKVYRAYWRGLYRHFQVPAPGRATTHTWWSYRPKSQGQHTSAGVLTISFARTGSAIN